MATVTFRRTADVDSIPVVDGSLVFDLSRNKIYMDNGNTRIQYGGDTDLISSVSSATGQNAFSATATVATFLQKTSVINTKANALAVTQNNIPLGCLAFKEMLGTNNYSGIGDGTVSGALTNLNSRTNTSQSGVNDLVSQLKASGTSFYFDYKDGKWGWNSSPARGAGTFHPFKSAPTIRYYNYEVVVNFSQSSETVTASTSVNVGISGGTPIAVFFKDLDYRAGTKYTREMGSSVILSGTTATVFVRVFGEGGTTPAVQYWEGQIAVLYD